MNDATLLLRQVHPSFMQGNRPSSQVFRPSPKDECKLSVYDGEQISPADAFLHYTEELKFSSCGVLAVSVSECASIDLPASLDPEPFPEHAVIDFSACSKSSAEKKAKKLRALAEKRDWLYRGN